MKAFDLLLAFANAEIEPTKRLTYPVRLSEVLRLIYVVRHDEAPFRNPSELISEW